MFPWRKINEHAAHTVLHIAPTLPYDPQGPFFAEKANYLKCTTFFFLFFFKIDILLKFIFSCNTCLQILSLYHLNKPWVLRWLRMSTGVSYQFHIFFWQHEKMFICPCLVAVAWPAAKAFLNAEMCCVAAVISPYPKGLLLLSFLQHRGVTCLAASIEENSIQSQRVKGWPI